MTAYCQHDRVNQKKKNCRLALEWLLFYVISHSGLKNDLWWLCSSAHVILIFLVRFPWWSIMTFPTIVSYTFTVSVVLGVLEERYLFYGVCWIGLAINLVAWSLWKKLITTFFPRVWKIPEAHHIASKVQNWAEEQHIVSGYKIKPKLTSLLLLKCEIKPTGNLELQLDASLSS